MTQLDRSQKAVIIRLDDSILVLQGFQLQLQSMDLVENSVFSNINQYLEKQFDICNYRITASSLLLCCGVYTKNPDTINYEDIYTDIDKHLATAIPSNIQINRLSGYDLPINLENIEVVQDNTIKISSRYHRHYSLSSLRIIDNNAKIFRILLEDPAVSILLSVMAFTTPHYYFSLVISADNHARIEDIETDLISNLKKSPYISGELKYLPKKYINSNPGKTLLGISHQSIDQSSYHNLVELVSTTLTRPRKTAPRAVHPRLDVSSQTVTGSPPFSKAEPPSLEDIPQVGDDTGATDGHDSLPQDRESGNSSPDKDHRHLLKRYRDYGWTVDEKLVLPDGNIPVYKLSNEDMYVDLVVCNGSSPTQREIDQYCDGIVILA